MSGPQLNILWLGIVSEQGTAIFININGNKVVVAKFHSYVIVTSCICEE